MHSCYFSLYLTLYVLDAPFLPYKPPMRFKLWGKQNEPDGWPGTPVWTGLRSTVGNVSDCRFMSEFRSRGHKFNPGPVPYIMEVDHKTIFRHSPPFCGFIQEGLLSVTSKSICTKSSLPRKKVWLGELIVPTWPYLLTGKQRTKPNPLLPN